MRLDKYDINIHDENTYWFISTGKSGSIIKAVLFQVLLEPNRVNLAMGDVNKITGEINFEDLTNNGDARKVFNTVGEIVKDYTIFHYEKEILLIGNTSDKKRIYSAMASAFINEINNDFYLWGGNVGGMFETFIAGKIYDAILVKRK